MKLNKFSSPELRSASESLCEPMSFTWAAFKHIHFLRRVPFILGLPANLLESSRLQLSTKVKPSEQSLSLPRKCWSIKKGATGFFFWAFNFGLSPQMLWAIMCRSALYAFVYSRTTILCTVSDFHFMKNFYKNSHWNEKSGRRPFKVHNRNGLW